MLFGTGDEDYTAPAGGVDSCSRCKGNDFDNGRCTNCGLDTQQLDVSNTVTISGEGHVVGSTYNLNGRNATPVGVHGNGRNRFAVGQMEIRRILSALNISRNEIRERAENTYKLAVTYDFVKAGRPVSHVAGGCIYMACRQALFPIFIIDISSILQMSAFRFGRLVKKLCKALYQKLKIHPLLAALGSSEYADPSLYIQRFTRDLEFGKDEKKIEKLACLVLQKMQNDWLQCGRHPAGLFGACIVIAARLLGHNRTYKEVARQVYVGGVTIGKRVYEFAQSTAGDMTPQDFKKLEYADNLGACADPPAYERAKNSDPAGCERAMLRKKLQELMEAEKPPAFVQEWLDKGSQDVLAASGEHEDDVALDDAELEGYILAENAVETKIKEKMYNIQYSDWENERAKKLAEKAQIAAEKKANRKRQSLPKNVSARKKARWNEASKLALNDPATKTVLEKAGQAVSVTPFSIVSADHDMTDEIKVEAKQEIVVNPQKSEISIPAMNPVQYTSMDETMSDVASDEEYARASDGDDFDPYGYEEDIWA